MLALSTLKNSLQLLREIKIDQAIQSSTIKLKFIAEQMQRKFSIFIRARDRSLLEPMLT